MTTDAGAASSQCPTISPTMLSALLFRAVMQPSTARYLRAYWQMLQSIQASALVLKILHLLKKMQNLLINDDAVQTPSSAPGILQAPCVNVYNTHVTDAKANHYLPPLVCTAICSNFGATK